MTEPALDPWVRDILRCPACRSTLADRAGVEPQLVCTAAGCGLVYPVRHGIPVLLVDEAQRPAGAGTVQGSGTGPGAEGTL